MSACTFRHGVMLVAGVMGALAPALAQGQGGDSADLMRQLMASATQAHALAAQATGQDAQGCDYRRRAIAEYRNSQALAQKLAALGQDGMRALAGQIDDRLTNDTRDFQIICRQQAIAAAAHAPLSTDDALPQIRALDAQVMKSLNSGKFHLKAAFKENAWANSDDEMAAMEKGSRLPPITSGSTKHWAACMDAKDARKAFNQALQWLEQEQSIAARANIDLRDAAAQAKAARLGLSMADKVC